MDENNLIEPSIEENALGMRDETINISDVIEVIETDPVFKESTNMFNGANIGDVGQQQQQQQQQQQPSTSRRQRGAFVKIIEQPASKALRFRYECEGRSAGSIPGASSTPENKTFPAIQVVGYKGRAVVVVSCVTKDPPYRPHPHNLVGREGCKRGVCTLEISPETMTATFSNLGIQCVKKKDIEAALRVREEIRVDPFRTGFAHRNQPTSIDLNTVRLCFQVFLESDVPGKFSVPLPAVVSEPIYDKKAMSDLNINKLSDCVSYVDGGRKDIILLCEKVAKEDIQVRFYEEKDGQIVWEAFADFQPSQVHKQHAIWFRTPRYRTIDIQEPVKVFIQLRRPSDGATSDPLPFELLPLDSEPGINRKRKKNDGLAQLSRQLEDYNKSTMNYGLNIVKPEPSEPSTSPFAGHMYGGLSPIYNPTLNQQPSPVYNFNISPSPIANDIRGATVTLNTDQSNLGAVGTNTNDVSFINLDSQEINNLVSTFPISEHLPEINNLSLSDINLPTDSNMMTDSLTRLANNALDSIYQLHE